MGNLTYRLITIELVLFHISVIVDMCRQEIEDEADAEKKLELAGEFANKLSSCLNLINNQLNN